MVGRATTILAEPTSARPVRTVPSPAALTCTAAAAGLVITTVVSVAPFAHFGYRSVPSHVALETVAALAGSVLAFLVYGRARRSHQVTDAVLAVALGLLATGDLFFALVPALAGTGQHGPFAVWAPLAVRVAAAALLAVAAAMRPRRTSRRAVRLVTAGLVVVALTVVLLWLFRAKLPLPLDPTLPPDLTGSPHIVGHPLALSLQLVQMCAYAVASVAFTRRASRTGDTLETWLGAAAALAAFARLNYFLYPSIYSEWVYTGDLLRTAFSLLLLVGAGYEVRTYWAAQAEAAVFADRRRVARDLHDGAVQEIGYVRSIAARRARDGDEEASRIVAATERALAEMRAALTALSARFDEPLPETLRRAACEVADRFDVPVELLAQDAVDATQTEREALVRIVREAVTNAVKHGNAKRVLVEVAAAPRRLVVRDDGHGFDPARHGRGFGLVSMRDRAEGLGGRLVVDSTPGAGTAVEVTW